MDGELAGHGRGMACDGWGCAYIGMAWWTEWHGIGIGMAVGRVCMVGVYAKVCDDVMVSSNDVVVCEWRHGNGNGRFGAMVKR